MNHMSHVHDEPCSMVRTGHHLTNLHHPKGCAGWLHSDHGF